MSTVSDYDGNSYSTITINSVEWLSTNLKTKHLSDGTAIKFFDGTVPNNADGVHDNMNLWHKGDTPMYAYPMNDERLVSTFGLLYNFAAVATGLLRPSSAYHVATAAEWAALITYYTSAALAGAALKKDGITVWDYPNTGATNSSEFAALPAGLLDRDGKPCRRARTAAFWTATADTTIKDDQLKATKYYLLHDSASLLTNSSKQSFGCSVRCIKT